MQLINKNVIDAVLQMKTKSMDTSLIVEDASRNHDTVEATVSISLQGLDIYGKSGIIGWYPLQVKHSEGVGDKIAQPLTKPIKIVRNSITTSVTEINNALNNLNNKNFNLNTINLNNVNSLLKNNIEYTAIAPETFDTMLANGDVNNIPYIKLTLIGYEENIN